MCFRSRLMSLSYLLSLCACGPELNVGSDVLWATDHETNDLSGWYASPKGGLLPDDSGSASLVNTVAGPAHSGRYSLKLTNLAAGLPLSDMEGPGVFRELVLPPDLYYSAWYYVPRPYQTKSQWTIMKFKLPGQGHDINLRTLPGGQMILYVYSHDGTQLQAPLADPPAFVPVETWFQVEVLLRARTDKTGKVLVWLNDRLVYDLEDRQTLSSTQLIWTPCNIAEDVQPFRSLGAAGTGGDLGAAGETGIGGQGGGDGGTGGQGGMAGQSGGAGQSGQGGSAAGAGGAARIPPELYIDDAAISLRRVTRSGRVSPDR